MNSKRRSGSGFSKNRHRARFEPLERRLCLSAVPLIGVPAQHRATTTPPLASISTQGHTLTIKDAGAGDTIAVTDNGAGTVNVLITYSAGGTLSGGGTAGVIIHDVVIDATGGGDTIDYAFGSQGISVTAAAHSSVKPAHASSTNFDESIFINATKGGNNISFTDPAGLTDTNLSLDIDAAGGANSPVNVMIGALSGSNLSLNVSATGGHNLVDESFGAATSSRLFSSFEGFGGNDTLDATLLGDLTMSSRASFSAFGGGGSNNLGVTVTGDVDSTSSLDAELSGGFKGSDTIGFTYSGTLDGKLFAATTGTGGNEMITQTLTADSGSTGSLNSLIATGKGSTANTLTLNLADDSGSSDGTAASTLKNVHAVILDQPGDTPTQNVSANDSADVTVITQKGHGWFWGWLGFGWGW